MIDFSEIGSRVAVNLHEASFVGKYYGKGVSYGAPNCNPADFYVSGGGDEFSDEGVAYLGGAGGTSYFLGTYRSAEPRVTLTNYCTGLGGASRKEHVATGEHRGNSNTAADLPAAASVCTSSPGHGAISCDKADSLRINRYPSPPGGGRALRASGADSEVAAKLPSSSVFDASFYSL